MEQKEQHTLRETKKGVMMRCKTITANFLKVVGLVVEPSTSNGKPKASLEAYLYVR